MFNEERALRYHREGRHGKIEVVPTKPCRTQIDLSLAYTPGVAVPCLEIAKNTDLVYEYTTRGNLVAVISNGTAVLGLGDIGPEAGKPVMEGKGILFKRFADIDVFDIEVATHDAEEFIAAVRLLEPTFGGINLEDIKAPECFIIEERLKACMNIPVFHDDQHGTAIITSAALINALEVTGRKPENLRLVVNGAGASAIACTNLYMKLGVKRENILMFDTKGLVYKGRKEGMNPYKEAFAAERDPMTLEQALDGADMFLGLSAKGALHAEWLRKMAPNPIVFALANPDPEILPHEAAAVRDDVLMATGRSDYPNQVNNVLGFPFIFRGALDVRARQINDEMKLAAVRALAQLAREEVPDSVSRAYAGRRFHFGREYLIPTPFDPRVILWVAPAVAQAAIDSGVARLPELNRDEYVLKLETKLGRERAFMRMLLNQARSMPKRIVFPEGDNPSVLRAVHLIQEEGIAKPVLIGNEAIIRARATELHCDIGNAEILDIPFDCTDECMSGEPQKRYIDRLFQIRARKGVTRLEACRQLSKHRNYLAALMVEAGEADGLVTGVTSEYRDAIRPVLQVVGRRPDRKVLCGIYLMLMKDRSMLFADCTVNVNPTEDDLVEIGLMTAEFAHFLGMKPSIAYVTYSNFGSTPNPETTKMANAARRLRALQPDLHVDGEMMVSAAIDRKVLDDLYPFHTLDKEANILVFPNLEAANVAYKLLAGLGGAQAIGPLLMGISKPFNVVHRRADSEEILYLAAITACQAQGFMMEPVARVLPVPDEIVT